VAREFDLSFEAIREGIRLFTGAQRRLEVKASVKGVTIVDDYGHHPTEIRETLAAAKQVWPNRLIVVFQPHRFSRTQALFPEFTECFEKADELILMDIYPAGEDPIAGVSSGGLQESLIARGQKNVLHIQAFDNIVEHLVSMVRPKDTVLTLGAGNVWKIGEALGKRLKSRRTTKG